MTRTLSIFFICLATLTSVLANSKKIEELERKLRKATDTTRVNILNELSGLYASSDLNHADSLAKEASALLERIDYTAGRINNLNHLSYIKSSLGQFDLGLDFSDEAIQTSKLFDDKQLLADSYDYRFMLLFQKGDYSEAQIYAELSNTFAEEAGSVRLIAKSYDNLGILQGIKGNHSGAIEFFMKSLEAYEQVGDDSKISLALMHLGHTFELAGNLNKALEYLKRSLQINKKIENKYNEGWTLVNIGVVYSRMNQVDSALTYYEASLALAEQINNHRLILTCLDNIGGKYSLKRDFEKANYYLQKAYRLSEKSGQNSRTVYISGNLAENYLYMGQFDSARIFGEKQLELALSSALISEQKVAYFILAQIYDSLGDYKRAHQSLLEYITVNDTIFNRQKSEQIESLRESFETEKKEQEITLLAQEKQSAEFRRNIYGIIAVLVFIIGVFVYNQQRIRSKRNKLLLAKEKELDRMKSRFFANISHEFRTPLTLILGPVTDLLARIPDPVDQKQLKVMKRNADRLLDLINQLLDLSKIEFGNMKLEMSKSDIITVLKGITLSFHSIMAQKEIKLIMDVTPNQLEINFDRSKFETILTNLLSNAFKFTPQHGCITVESKVVSKKFKKGSKEYFEVSITDTGPGIPGADIRNIFNRFYQSENNQLSQQEGSGIGLALSKELVELHQGRIEATSQVDEGTKIVFDIPVDLPAGSEQHTNEVIKPLKALEINQEVDIREGDPVVHRDRPVVLVIEDHPEVQTYIQDVLNAEYVMLSAYDGEEGISKAVEKIPDLIISDVMMPKKDGYEVCRALKQDERTSHIPIILLTAKSDTEDKIEGLQQKADDYVTKPFVPRELLARVANMIESRNRIREKYKKEGVLKPKDIAVNSVDEKFLNRLIEVVEQNINNEKFGVEQLGNELNMSRSQLHRKLTALLGQGPNQFIRTFRLQRAHDLLRQNSATTAEIAYQVGFSSPSYFTKCFHEQYGYTPSEIPG